MSDEVRSLGRYVLHRPIGEGGMGRVYLAHDPRLKRNVAIKVIIDAALWDASLVKRFDREIKTASAVNHPNLIQVFDRGETEGRRWFAMEYVPGLDLKTLIERRGRLDPPEIRRIGVEVGGALRALHRAGILHRDLKPANVMRRDDGSHVLMDLGLAKLRQATALTRTHEMLGTPKYMSAEMILGTPLDARSDLYQLGLILWTAAVGRLPDSMGTFIPETRALEMARTLPPLKEIRPDFPRDLAELIDRCVAYHAERRPADLTMFLRQLGLPEEEISASLPRPEAPALPSQAMAALDAPSPPRTAALRRIVRGGIALLVLAGIVYLAKGFLVPRADPPHVRNLTILPGIRAVRVQWETDRPVPGQIQVWPQGGDAKRLISSPDAPSRFHSLLIDGLESGRPHRAVILHEGRAISLEHTLRSAPSLSVLGPRIDLSQGWPPTLRWELSPPACASLSYRQGEESRQLSSPPMPNPRASFRPPAWDMTERLEDVLLEVTAIGGTQSRQLIGPLDGMTGLWKRCLELRVTGGVLTKLRPELEAAKSLADARENCARRLDELGLLELFGEVLESGRGLFGKVPLRRCFMLHESLLDFEKVNQLAFRRFGHDLWRIAETKRAFLQVDDELSDSHDAVTVLRLDLPEWKDYFFPIDLPDELMEARVKTVRLLLPVEQKPYRSFSAQFDVTKAQLEGRQHVELSFEAHAFFTEYYFELSLDDWPPVLVFNHQKEDDQGITLAGMTAMDASGPRLTTWRPYRVRLPVEVLPPGRHRFRLTLHSLGGAGNLLTGARSFRVRLR